MKVIRNYLQPKLNVLVFGATGLVGKELVNILQHDNRYENITIANRQQTHYSNHRIQEIIVDFERLHDLEEYFEVDHVFICLGTTIKKAGSQLQFRKVDLEYPVEIARMAKNKNVRSLVHISALGADKDSSNFYLNTKGKAEERISKLGPQLSYAVRPSMLFGKRKEKRLGESIGKFLMKNLEFLMVNRLKKYRGINAKDVASAMIEIANKKPDLKYIPSEDLKVISKYNFSK